jgi:hypothetical protein
MEARVDVNVVYVGICTAVGIATICGSQFQNIHISIFSGPAAGLTQRPIQWTPGALSLAVKRPGLETDHSPPTSTETKKCGSIYPVPLRLHGVVLS